MNTLERNPLALPTVAKCLISKLAFSEWLSARLVCSLWNEVILQHLGKKSVIEASLPLPHSIPEEFVHLKLHWNTEDIIDWEDFHQAFTLHLEVQGTNTSVCSLAELFTQLKNLKQFRLDVQWGSTNSPMKDFSALSTYPQNYNLTTFKYINLTSIKTVLDVDGHDFHFPFSIHQLLHHTFPNLRELTFVGLLTNEVDELIHALSGNELHSLEKLEIFDENQCCEIVSAIQLHELKRVWPNLPNLKELGLELNCVNPVLNEELTFPHSIRKLNVRRFPMFSAFPPLLIPGNLDGLTTLSFSEGLIEEIPSTLQSLQELCIVIRNYSLLESYPFLARQSSILTNITKIEVDPPLPLQSVENLEHLMTVCPHVNALKLRFNDELVIKLWTIGRQIVHLHIVSWDGLTDAGITGILNGEYQRSQPYVGNMPELETLTIEVWPDYSNRITNASVINGLNDVPKLSKFTGIRTSISTEVLQSTNIQWKLWD